MAFIVVLICLGVQRYLHFGSYSYQLSGLSIYYHWMQAKVKSIVKGHAWTHFIFMILPLLAAAGIVIALIYHLLGAVGYFLVTVLLLWYGLDGRDLRKEPYAVNNENELLVLVFERQFAVLFWFFLLGAIGLLLYLLIVRLRDWLQQSMNEKGAELLQVTQQALGVLDWLPARLLGLSFALVGHFASVFKLWIKEWRSGIHKIHAQIIGWGMAALDRSLATQREAKQVDTTQHFEHSELIIALLDRALLVWLVVMALVSIG